MVTRALTVRRLVTPAMLLGALLCPAAAAAAPPGVLDPAFGSGGVVSLPSGTQLFGVAAQANGEAVAVGQAGGNVLAERFATSGALDGVYVGGPGVAHAVTVQADGKIVLAGNTGGTMFVERLGTNLAPDTSFGAGGVTTALAGASAVANAVALGPGGEIVAAGSQGGPDTRPVAIELTSSGAFAPGFGAGGIQGLDWGPYSFAAGAVVQPNGQIVLAGQQSPGQPTNGVLVRLNANGTTDNSFGNGFVQYHYPGGGYTSFTSVALQNDLKVVVGGIDVGGPHAIFARFTSAGNLDPSFGSAGVAALPSQMNLNLNPGAPIGAHGVGIAGGGRIVGAGMLANTSILDVDAAAWALTPIGAPEPTFGNNGLVDAPAGGFESCAMAVAPDGSILAAGDRVPVGTADNSPCSVSGSSSGFVARYGGFGPPPPPPPPASGGSAPAALTGAATGVGSTSATLTGAVNPDGLATSYHFDYGTSTAYGASTSAVSAGSGSTAVAVSATLGSLSPNTTYHYRLVASNASGTTDGADATFTTAASGGGGATKPSATTAGANGITEVSARLNGSIDPGSDAATYRFQYGTTTQYGASTAGQSTTNASNVSATLRKLKPGTTYHYRLVATNSAGSSYGKDASFRTAPRLGLKLLKANGRYSLKTALAHGLAVGLTCSQACRLSGSLTISAATAGRLHLGRKGLTIASDSATGRSRRTATLTIRIGRRYATSLGRTKSFSATLRIAARPTSGGPTVISSRTVTLG
jgi:uncharacterized delta-60 repeat protein